MGGKQAAVGNDGCQTDGGIEGGCELRMAVSTSAHGEPSKRRGTFSADGRREGKGRGEGGGNQPCHQSVRKVSGT